MGQVPDNWDYGLRDVKDAIGGGVESLRDCFDNANTDGFDPAYEGDKNSLRNFRNYDHEPPAEDINFTVEIRDEQDMSVIENISVAVSDESEGDIIDSGITDWQGQYTFTVPEPGDYWVRIGLNDWQEVSNVSDGDSRTLYHSEIDP